MSFSRDPPIQADRVAGVNKRATDAALDRSVKAGPSRSAAECWCREFGPMTPEAVPGPSSTALDLKIAFGANEAHSPRGRLLGEERRAFLETGRIYSRFQETKCKKVDDLPKQQSVQLRSALCSSLPPLRATPFRTTTTYTSNRPSSWSDMTPLFLILVPENVPSCTIL
jgi:hypothetical protein